MSQPNSPVELSSPELRLLIVALAVLYQNLDGHDDSATFATRDLLGKLLDTDRILQVVQR